MHVLIVNAQVIAVGQYLTLAALYVVQFANHDGVIVPLSSNKGFAQFNEAELLCMCAGLEVDGSGKDYGDLIVFTRNAILERKDWLQLDCDEAMACEQARSVGADNKDPMTFVPNSPAPSLRESWAMDGGINRMRIECSYWIHFASLTSLPSNYSTVKVASRNNPQSILETNMAKAAAKEASPKAAPKAAPAAKAAKAERVEQNGIIRPRAGGKCAAVWDLADRITKSTRKPAKAADVLEQGVAEGLNESNIRCEYQRWRKFNGLKRGE